MNNEKRSFLSTSQKDGSTLCAEKVANDVTAWLQSVGCADLVGRHLIEQYAVAVARWKQAEETLSRYGLIAKQGRAGSVCESPYVAIAERYQKQSTALWTQITRVVRINGKAGANVPQLIQKSKGGSYYGAYYKRTTYGAGRQAYTVCQ